MTDLGRLGQTVIPSSINARNEVVGWGGSDGFFWSLGTGTIPIAVSSATSISSTGWITGQAGHYSAAVIKPGGTLFAIPVLPGGNGYGQSYDVNESGFVVGKQLTTIERAFLWSEATGVIDLGTLPGANAGAIAFSVNNSGQVVGTCRSSNQSTAFLWDSSFGIQDLGLPPIGATGSHALAVNDAWTVVGYLDGLEHAFRWTPLEGFIDLTPGTGHSEANFVSEVDEITGSYEGRGYIWHPDGTSTDVSNFIDSDSSDWSAVQRVTGINQDGAIVGTGVRTVDGTTDTHGFIALPVLNEVVSPITMAVRLGKIQSGDLNSVSRLGDGNALTLCKFLVPNQSVEPINIEFTAQASTNSVSRLIASATSKKATAGLFGVILDLYDWTNQRFDSQNGLQASLQSTFTTLRLKPSTPNKYVNASQQIVFRLRFKSLGPSAQVTWCCDIDQVEFLLTL